jgi:hypothetical protein
MLPTVLTVVVFYVIGRVFTTHPWTTVFILWAAGWLISAGLTAISKPMRASGVAIALVGSLALTFMLWPGFLWSDLEGVWPRVAVWAGLRPSWTLPQADDLFQQTWKTSDAQEFSATAFGLPGAARIVAELESGKVFQRVRMLRPEERPPGKWREMRRVTRTEWANATEEMESLNEKPPFQSNLKLERGRYALEFRVETTGEAEEFSGIVLVVS